MSENPLLERGDLPRFSAIRPEHVSPAIDRILTDNREAIERILADGPDSWENLVEPLEELEDRLSQAWSPVGHLVGVCNTPELREAYNANLGKLSDYATELGQHQGLFKVFGRLAERAGELALDPVQRKVINDELRDFRLSGVALPADKQARFKEIQQELSTLEAKFEENLIDAAAAWHLKVNDEDQLKGIPSDAVARARDIAEQHDASGWWFALDFPHFHAVITHAENNGLRRQIYEAWMTRGSDRGPTAGLFDNTVTMKRILELRAEEAGLLGYANFAEVSLASKMAETPAEVESFLTELVNRVQPKARQEFRELQEFAQDELALPELNAWDVGFASERLRKARYDISQEELRPYFPLSRVMQGLFWLVGELYGFTVEELPVADAWHETVRLFAIHDAAGKLRGRLYMDLFARPQKRSGAWMDEVKNRFRHHDELQSPVAHLVCNFAPPQKDNKPSLLTHEDVETLFHEFGHCLHHLVTQVDYPSVAGINGVAWDAVELPSQFHENFCWDRKALGRISGHFETGKPLPDELFDKMTAARHFNTGLFLLRQLEFALFDIRLHASNSTAFETILAETRKQVAVVPQPEFNRFAHTFSHVFAGGYAAGYYSYLWAEVMSSDAFAAFEENGVLDRATGQRFLSSILERGGSAEPGDLFREFRGRAATQDAFLRHHGMENAA